jgi:hypothetical protein
MEEAYEKQRYVHEVGPSLRAFSFKNAFDVYGRQYKINKHHVRRLCQEIPAVAPFHFSGDGPP